MSEAEDVLIDAARHATDFAQALWRRHRPPQRRRTLLLADLQPRLDVLLTAVYGRSFSLRVAHPPAPDTLLGRIFRRREGPRQRAALPATDGTSIWLPRELAPLNAAEATTRYRLMALRQAMRAVRGSAELYPHAQDPLLCDLYLLIEGFAADHQLVRLLPGLAASTAGWRAAALASRPPLSAFPDPLKPLEQLVRHIGALDFGEPEHAVLAAVLPCPNPAESLALAKAWAVRLREAERREHWGAQPLMKDPWLGELRPPPPRAEWRQADAQAAVGDDHAVRSARLQRRPEVRQASDDEDDENPGVWMVQTSEPHERAEDPIGLQRPTDRDTSTAAEEFADALSELPEARLVTSPGRSKEVLLSEDTPLGQKLSDARTQSLEKRGFAYPEWDYRQNAYRVPGALVHERAAASGPQAWVDRTLAVHRGMLDEIRRRFELLRSHRVRVRKQLDGEGIDLDAYVEGYADFRAGLTFPERLYQTTRRLHRDLAIMLSIDVSGSTDSWVAGNRRIIDVEREALLLVCIALDGLQQPYAVQAFSGEGPTSVIVRNIKRFDEPFDNGIEQRIAGLEPEHYTRVGAALRHATTLLMKQAAKHRLLLLLSDGKPNDIDEYESRYGVEDMRQAVNEARLQGISPFCLTIDRQAASYLPFVFGAHHYALLTRPELLPKVLLNWLRRLISA